MKIRGNPVRKRDKACESSDMTDMLETPRADSPAYLRHEYRTPVNHVVGYSELLIDEAARVEDAMYKALRPMLAVG